ncbi:hypothetical protein [[Eubacterium] cellulosolvens]
MKSYDTIDVFRGIGAAIILLVIIGISIHYYQIEEERLQQEELQAKKEPAKPSRLVIILPNEVHVNQAVPINIAVVDLNGLVSDTREDLVEISLLTQGKSMVGIKRTNRIAWSRTINLQLNNGTGEFWFTATDIETVTIIVRQISGDTPLEETRIMFIILRERGQ